MALIFDIETIGQNFDEMDEVSQKNLTRWIGREAAGNDKKYSAMITEVKDGLNFSPLTGEIAAIGIYDTEKDKGVVYYQSPDQENRDIFQENFIFKAMTEEEMLNKFWEGVRHYEEFVSFNGRGFDVPFLMIRSAVHKIRPSINLLADRYLRYPNGGIRHIDLFDQFSFHGVFKRKGNLHLYCKAFGIRSPKAEGISGEDMTSYFRERRYIEIAEYNSWDLIATWELYQVWDEYLKF
jgi:hypothetical protein